jgi:hypothetical protein
MSKHTPGPWELTTEEGGMGDCRVIRANGEPLMCDTQYYPWCPESDADWRLIAAAPDLLEALKAVTTAGDVVAYGAALHDARAAIAKATGEQS